MRVQDGALIPEAAQRPGAPSTPADSSAFPLERGADRNRGRRDLALRQTDPFDPTAPAFVAGTSLTCTVRCRLRDLGAFNPKFPL